MATPTDIPLPTDARPHAGLLPGAWMPGQAVSYYRSKSNSVVGTALHVRPTGIGIVAPCGRTHRPHGSHLICPSFGRFGAANHKPRCGTACATLSLVDPVRQGRTFQSSGPEWGFRVFLGPARKFKKNPLILLTCPPTASIITDDEFVHRPPHSLASSPSSKSGGFFFISAVCGRPPYARQGRERLISLPRIFCAIIASSRT